MNPFGVLRKSNRWEDFKTQLQSFTRKQKGDCFEALTKCFLELDPKYKTHLDAVWFLKDVPAHVHKHLNLPGPDEGIDLVARTRE